MPSILIQLDERTLKSLNEVTPAAKRQRSAFVRQAIKDAIRRVEDQRIKEAYIREPDSDTGADDWSSAGEWKP